MKKGKNSKKNIYGEKSLNDNETFKIDNTSLHEDNLRLILNNSWMQHCQTLSLKYYCISIRKWLLTIVLSFCWNCDLLCVCRVGTITFIKGVIVLWRLPRMSAKDMLSFSQLCLCQHCIVCWAGWLCCVLLLFWSLSC